MSNHRRRRRCSPRLRARRSFARCAGLLGLLAATATLAEDLHYEAQVAWLQAGDVTLSHERDGDAYELSGTVVTSRVVNRFFKWRGRFASVGRFVDGFPQSRAYLLFAEDRDDREILLAFDGKTTVHTSDGDFEELVAPRGSDLMSVMFLADHCLTDTIVHDGEDAYHLVPVRSRERELHQAGTYYSGDTLRCDYRFRYVDGSTRRVTVWMAEVNGRRLPVRIQVRVPLLPDGILRLRVDKVADSPA